MSRRFFASRAPSPGAPPPSRSPSRLGCGLLAAALAASACSDEGGGDGPAGEEPAYFADAVACGAESHEPCDVLAPECQARLAEIAACQWGGAGTAPVLPPINVLTRPMVRERLAAAATQGATTPAPVVAAATAVLGLLGLVPTSFDSDAAVDVTANLLLAQYDPATDQIILVEDARTGDPIADNEILFHELIHAQQAARYDLQGLLASVTTLDSLIGIRALFEGEAQFHQNIIDFGMFGVPIEPDTFRQGLDAFRDVQDDALFADAAGAWNRSLILAPYIYGPYPILDTWLRGGPAAMAQRYAAPATESLEMLQGALAPAASTGSIDVFPANNVFAPPGGALPAAGDEAYPLGIDRLGAWTIYVLARLAGSAEADALALGWRGDQLDVFELDAGGYAGRFRVRFDTAAHASAFESLMLQNPNADVRTSNGYVVVTVMAEGETPEWLFGPLAR